MLQQLYDAVIAAYPNAAVSLERDHLAIAGPAKTVAVIEREGYCLKIENAPPALLTDFLKNGAAFLQHPQVSRGESIFVGTMMPSRQAVEKPDKITVLSARPFIETTAQWVMEG